MAEEHEERENVYKGLPTFDGKKENYQKFKLKFNAYANAKGFLEVLSEDDNELPADPNAEELTDAQRKSVKVNKNAVCAYTMALVGDDVFDIIPESRTTEYPNGLGYLITKELEDQFKPEDGTSKLEYLKCSKNG